MRQKFAREPFEEKIRKVSQLIRLAKSFPRHARRLAPEGAVPVDVPPEAKGTLEHD